MPSAKKAFVDGLRSLGTEGQGVADSLPWLRLYRGLEAGFGGVFAVGDAFEDVDAVVDGAADFAGVGGGDGIGLGPGSTGCGGCHG